MEGRCLVFIDVRSLLGLEGDIGSISRKFKIKVSIVNKLCEVLDGRVFVLVEWWGSRRSMSKFLFILGMYVNLLWRGGF